MCFYIYIEDLVANALIEVLSKDQSKRFLTYTEIEKYGAVVVEELEKRKEKAVLVLSRENTDRMLRNYSDFFEENGDGQDKGVSLKNGKTVDELIEQFRGYIAIDVLLAFVNERSVRTVAGV